MDEGFLKRILNEKLRQQWILSEKRHPRVAVNMLNTLL